LTLRLTIIATFATYVLKS